MKRSEQVLFLLKQLTGSYLIYPPWVCFCKVGVCTGLSMFWGQREGIVVIVVIVVVVVQVNSKSLGYTPRQRA